MAKRAGFLTKLLSTVSRLIRPKETIKSLELEEPVSRLTPEPTKPPEPPKAPKVDKIQALRNDVQPVINEANERWRKLDDLDLRSTAISRALEENDRHYFDVSQLTDQGEIIAEATRARVFLQDRTSIPEGAEDYMRQEVRKQYEGQFGNEYNTWEHKFKNFNTDIIDEKTARLAFRAYRMLEEIEGSRIGRQGQEGAYGSENMIIDMYDMAIKQGWNDENDDELAEELAGMGKDLIDRTLGIKRWDIDKNFEEANEVSNILDVIEWEERYF